MNLTTIHPNKPNDTPARPRNGRNRDRLNSRRNGRRPGVDRSPRPTQKRPPPAYRYTGMCEKGTVAGALWRILDGRHQNHLGGHQISTADRTPGSSQGHIRENRHRADAGHLGARKPSAKPRHTRRPTLNVSSRELGKPLQACDPPTPDAQSHNRLPSRRLPSPSRPFPGLPSAALAGAVTADGRNRYRQRLGRGAARACACRVRRAEDDGEMAAAHAAADGPGSRR